MQRRLGARWKRFDGAQVCLRLSHSGESDHLHNSGLDAGIKLRPTVEELEELGSQFKNQWADYFANTPDKPVIWVGPISACVTGFYHASRKTLIILHTRYLGDPSVATARKYYSVGYYTVTTGLKSMHGPSLMWFQQYPASRGSVHIKSGDDPHAAPDFNPGFLRK